jgi:transcriptional regulator with XRE-family HTH domain
MAAQMTAAGNPMKRTWRRIEELEAYLESEELTKAEFARIAGLSEATVSLLSRGHVWPSRETAGKIAEATNGKVTANDFVKVTPRGRGVSRSK